MNILLIGMGYFPFRLASDKNFFYELIPEIGKNIQTLVILSLNDQKDNISIQKLRGRKVTIYNVRRPLHFHLGKGNKFLGTVGTLHYYHHCHNNPLQEIVERYITMHFSIAKIRYILQKYKIDVIHIMDNLGLAMGLIRRKFADMPIVCSALIYSARSPVYNLYFKSNYRRLNRIVCYTEEMKKQLIRIRLPEEKLSVIRWGIRMPAKKFSLQEKKNLRIQLGYAPDSKLLLWTGFIQQVQARDFYKTIKVANEIVDKVQDVEFVFCFKPESYQKKYARNIKKRIKVVTNIDYFLKLLETADFLLSPIQVTNSIVAPPLTWIEAMALETPVITTRVRGANEIIVDGITGYIANSYDELSSTIFRAIHDKNLPRVSKKASDFIRREYNLEKSARDYLNLWGQIGKK